MTNPNQQYEILKKMIKERAVNVNSVNGDGESFLMYFIDKQQVIPGHTKIIKLLLKNGADPNQRSNYRAVNIKKNKHLLKRSTEILSPNITLLLIKYGADVNITGLLRQSLTQYYHIKIGNGIKSAKYLSMWMEIINIILSNNPDLNSIKEHHPLNLACKYADYDMIKLLLEKGVDPNVFDTNNKYCRLHHAYQIVNSDTDTETMIKILDILMEYGMKIDDDSDCRHIIYHAIRNDDYIFQRNPNHNVDIVRFLINRGANVKARIDTNFLQYTTGLDKAVGMNKSNPIDLVKLLLEKGADPNNITCYGSVLTRFAYRLLRYNMDYRDYCPQLYDKVKLLIEYGADLNVKDKYDKNLLDILIHIPSLYDVIELVMDNGIEINNKNRMFESYIYEILRIGQISDDVSSMRCVMDYRDRPFSSDEHHNIVKIIKLLLHSGATFNRVELIDNIKNHCEDDVMAELGELILEVLLNIPPVVSLRRLCLNILPRSIPDIPEAFFYWPNDYDL